MADNIEYTIVDDYNGKSVYTERIKTTVKKGISFGSCLAMVISYVSWQSVFWAIIHGCLGWIYVIYYLLRY